MNCRYVTCCLLSNHRLNTHRCIDCTLQLITIVHGRQHQGSIYNTPRVQSLALVPLTAAACPTESRAIRNGQFNKSPLTWSKNILIDKYLVRMAYG